MNQYQQNLVKRLLAEGLHINFNVKSKAIELVYGPKTKPDNVTVGLLLLNFGLMPLFPRAADGKGFVIQIKDTTGLAFIRLLKHAPFNSATLKINNYSAFITQLRTEAEEAYAESNSDKMALLQEWCTFLKRGYDALPELKSLATTLGAALGAALGPDESSDSGIASPVDLREFESGLISVSVRQVYAQVCPLLSSFLEELEAFEPESLENSFLKGIRLLTARLEKFEGLLLLPPYEMRETLDSLIKFVRVFYHCIERFSLLDAPERALTLLAVRARSFFEHPIPFFGIMEKSPALTHEERWTLFLEFIALGFDPNQCNQAGDNCFHEAARRGYRPFIERALASCISKEEPFAPAIFMPGGDKLTPQQLLERHQKHIEQSIWMINNSRPPVPQKRSGAYAFLAHTRELDREENLRVLVLESIEARAIEARRNTEQAAQACVMLGHHDRAAQITLGEAYEDGGLSADGLTFDPDKLKR